MAKPDFTGTWRFNPSKSALQIPAPDENTFIVEHHEPNLRLSRTWVSGANRDTFSIDLTTDGVDSVVERGDARIRARAFWEGDVLAFDSTVARGGVEGTNAVRYTMAEDGRSFVARERFRSEPLNYDNVWWMDRAGGQ
ncbi:MAG: hypothetical protein A3J29_16475 [Acidobacteria bacterium RIFCSPLOWO2_12_FULL_67_14b]|nr:MAG: hypothetical protein A3J29_16475 [Acidobacteria bacterium RIFCSPLOWO2_12_FULL_67_14b]